jgi:hypothetical protein
MDLETHFVEEVVADVESLNLELEKRQKIAPGCRQLLISEIIMDQR